MTATQRAWPGWARAFAACLVAVSRVSPALLALAFVRDTTIEPRVMLSALVGLAALPAAAAWLLDRAHVASIALDDRTLRITRRDATIEIPRDAIARVAPWRVPLPGVGVALRLRSGAAAPVGLEPPPPVLCTGLESHPLLAWSAARRAAPLAWARHPAVQFGLFALLPAAGLFRAHQVIGFGGLFGQIYLESFAAWATTLAITWASTCVGLFLYASVLRAVAEIGSVAATFAAPRRARAIRRGAEWFVALGYYAGAPGFLLLRFLA